MSSDRKLLFVVLSLWLIVVSCFLTAAFASAPRLKSIASGSFVLSFAIVGMFSAGKMVVDGKVGLGLRGSSATDFVHRDEQPVRFWKIVVVIVVVSLLLLLLGIGFVSGWLASPIAGT